MTILELPRWSCQTIQLSSSGQVAFPVTMATQYSVVKIFEFFVKIFENNICENILENFQNYCQNGIAVVQIDDLGLLSLVYYKSYQVIKVIKEKSYQGKKLSSDKNDQVIKVIK